MLMASPAPCRLFFISSSSSSSSSSSPPKNVQPSRSKFLGIFTESAHVLLTQLLQRRQASRDTCKTSTWSCLTMMAQATSKSGFSSSNSTLPILQRRVTCKSVGSIFPWPTLASREFGHHSRRATIHEQMWSLDVQECLNVPDH